MAIMSAGISQAATMAEQQSRVAELFVRERTRFLRFVRRRFSALSLADAEDILSDVLSAFFYRPHLLDDIERLDSYVYRALTNRVIDRQRKPSSVSLDDDDPGSGEPSVLSLIDTRPGPDAEIRGQEIRRRLVEALDELDPKERAVWLATEIEGRSFRELAETFGEPIGTLLSRKSRAAHALRQKLQDLRDSAHEEEL